MRFNSVHIIQKPNSTTVLSVRAVVEQIVADHNLPLCNMTGSDVTSKTLIIAIGGDGTMLQAMRFAVTRDAVAMGINMGRVGFLTDFVATRNPDVFMIEPIRGLIQLDEILVADNHPIEERTVVQASIDFGYTVASYGIAANEVSISRRLSDSMIQYQLIFDNVDAGIHRANSVIVATPTGSTAYSLSAGGTLMYPTVQGLQVVPVAPLTLTSRPIIVSEQTQININVWGDDVTLRMDGNSKYETTDLVAHDPLRVTIRTHDKKVRILHSKEYNFFNMLSTKLGWIKE